MPPRRRQPKNEPVGEGSYEHKDAEPVGGAASGDITLGGVTEVLKKLDLAEDEGKSPPATKRKTEPSGDSQDDGIYCVGFIRPSDGSRKSELHYRVFVSNDVGAQRKAWQGGSPNNLKTEGVIYCKKGNADVVLKAWDTRYENCKVKSRPGWYLISKDSVNKFIDAFGDQEDYEKVTESRGKKPKKSK